MRVQDTLDYLTGEWTLDRAIVDHRGAGTGAFEGHGALRTAGRRGRYEEWGRLRLGGYDGSARRALDLIAGPDGAVAVRFVDGRPFFELDLVTGTCRAVHPCRQDRYELEFEVSSPDVLVERWRVTGPAKDYEARTVWRRRTGLMARSLTRT
ncbi:MAG TPA: DUF6314 family protein [Solirubrobacteraceae bacterium]|jgi:hypothetical protein|nr:DUF6314 family protein [Solirubrobacteraceae bacterium]